MKLGEIAERLDCSLEGPADLEITGVAGMEEAGESQLTFLSNPKYVPKLRNSRAGAIIVSRDTRAPDRVLLRADDPYLAFAKALEIFHPPARPKAGIHQTAVIAPSARIGRNASIGAYVVVEEEVEIGDDCLLKPLVMIYRGAKIGHRFTAHSHAVVREGVRIGNDVILQNGVVLGADGFGFARKADGSWHKIIQAGSVVVEDGVEIQANTCVDRGTIGETRLGPGVKVDNLVQVAHGCTVGENTLLCSQVGLAGSSKVGRNVILTGQVGVAGHLTIGDNVIVTPQSGVASDVEPNRTVSGSPVIDHFAWLKWAALYSKLPEMYSTYLKVKKLVEPKANHE